MGTSNWKLSQDGLTASRILDNGGAESKLVSSIPASELAVAIPADAPTTAQFIAIGESAAQKLLDTTAQSWGYDSLLSASSYVNSTVAKYKAEATALIAWRDAVWSAAYAIETAVPLVLPSTTADFLALLPPVPVRP